MYIPNFKYWYAIRMNKIIINDPRIYVETNFKIVVNVSLCLELKIHSLPKLNDTKKPNIYPIIDAFTNPLEKKKIRIKKVIRFNNVAKIPTRENLENSTIFKRGLNLLIFFFILFLFFVENRKIGIIFLVNN